MSSPIRSSSSSTAKASRGLDPERSKHLSAVFTAFVEARAGVVEFKLRLDPGLKQCEERGHVRDEAG